ncbi:MAG: hypothetical protein HY331_02820 [Chloroflexi bacterium]|nr:hypothetical protein [Chloroflexota bacterium]
MAFTIRFRLVIFGDLAQPGMVTRLIETPDGKVFLRDAEFAWPVATALAEATVHDLPAFYRDRHFPIHLLPVQEVTGDTAYEAAKRVIAEIDRLYGAGAAQKRAHRDVA